MGKIGIRRGGFARRIIEQRRGIGDPPGVAELLVELIRSQCCAEHRPVGKLERICGARIRPEQPLDRARRGAGRQIDGIAEIRPVVLDIDHFAGVFDDLVGVFGKRRNRAARQRQRVVRRAEGGGNAIQVERRRSVGSKGYCLVADLDADFGRQRGRAFIATQRRQTDLDLEIVACGCGFGEHEFADGLEIVMHPVECR